MPTGWIIVVMYKYDALMIETVHMHCLPSHTNRDNLRGFFEQNFPNLLRNIFGFEGQGWLASAAQV